VVALTHRVAVAAPKGLVPAKQTARQSRRGVKLHQFLYASERCSLVASTTHGAQSVHVAVPHCKWRMCCGVLTACVSAHAAWVADLRHLGCERVPQAQSRHDPQAQQVPGASAAGVLSLAATYVGMIWGVQVITMQTCSPRSQWRYCPTEESARPSCGGECSLLKQQPRCGVAVATKATKNLCILAACSSFWVNEMQELGSKEMHKRA
jgi:hypothetical protein